MASCPYLSLEEYGTEPFPFPSSSHCCYVSEVRLPIGQQEQERYCLTKKYTSCPLFLSQSVREKPADEPSEPMARPARPEVAVEPPREEPVEALPTQEEPVEKPIEVLRIDRSPEPVVEQPLPEKVEPPLRQEALPGQPPPAEAAGKPPSAVAEPSLSKTPETVGGAPSIAFRVLPWAAAGGLVLTLLCVGVLAVASAAHALPQIHPPSLTLSSLWPGALLLVSATSFVVAILLVGLLLWTRRSAPE